MFNLEYTRKGVALAALTLASAVPGYAAAQQKTAQVQVVNTYADIADLALSAPVVVQAKIMKTMRINEKISPGIPAGHERFLVYADIERLVASRSPLPSTISYLVDVPLDSRGKTPRLKGADVFLFLKPSAGSAEQFTLTSRYSQIAATPEADKMIRAALTEAMQPENNFTITGIGNAFYVPGTVAGESESQIFLTTSNQRPVSLSILRRPGEVTRWSVSLSEIVDDTTAPAKPNTLLWYKLACFLPRQLPQSVIQADDAGHGQAIAADYAFVLAQLGPCTRMLGQPAGSGQRLAE